MSFCLRTKALYNAGDFYNQAWNADPQASFKNQGNSKKWYKKTNLFRKMCAFDGNFERFVFYDADSLAMSPLNRVLEKLDHNDFVFDDWEHRKQSLVAALNFSVIEKAISLPEVQVRPLMHCSSFFGSKRGILGKDELEMLREHLVEKQGYTG
jgi:hypothetical protein